jgi:DNA-binding protein H-NS
VQHRNLADGDFSNLSTVIDLLLETVISLTNEKTTLTEQVQQLRDAVASLQE